MKRTLKPKNMSYNEGSPMTKPEPKDKIRQLHECNSEIYDIIDRIKEIGVDVSLAFQNLRSATNDIQKAIGTLIDKGTNGKEEE